MDVRVWAVRFPLYAYPRDYQGLARPDGRQRVGVPHAADTVWGGVDKDGGYRPSAADDRDDRLCVVCVATFPA